MNTNNINKIRRLLKNKVLWLILFLSTLLLSNFVSLSTFLRNRKIFQYLPFVSLLSLIILIILICISIIKYIIVGYIKPYSGWSRWFGILLIIIVLWIFFYMIFPYIWLMIIYFVYLASSL